jgi:hypothetical protein
MGKICTAAKEAGIPVVLGFSENEHNSLYIAQCIISSTGEIVMQRRKIKPTHMERTSRPLFSSPNFLRLDASATRRNLTIYTRNGLRRRRRSKPPQRHPHRRCRTRRSTKLLGTHTTPLEIPHPVSAGRNPCKPPLPPPFYH